MSLPQRHRSLSPWVRWLHTYVSMLGFASLLFFAITGITLNHADWLEGTERVSEVDGHVAPKLLAANVDKLAVVEHLRRAHAITAALHDFNVDDAECVVVFKQPGRADDATIARNTGDYHLSTARRGAIAVLNDLHKGRDSGTTWSWFIDISAVVLAVAGATGLWLLWYVRRRRIPGLVWACIGLLLPLTVYLVAVP